MSTKCMKIYSGIRLNPVEGVSSNVMVTVHEQFEDKKFLPIGDLKHRVFHSPSGLEWGYMEVADLQIWLVVFCGIIWGKSHLQLYIRNLNGLL